MKYHLSIVLLLFLCSCVSDESIEIANVETKYTPVSISDYYPTDVDYSSMGVEYITNYSTSGNYHIRDHCEIDKIVVHNTANKRKHADAIWHSDHLNVTSRNVSWHFSVDHKNTVKSFPLRYATWHCGNKEFNYSSIGIEVCENEGIDKLAAWENLDRLVKSLLLEYPHSIIMRHKDVPGVKKNCPGNINEDEWATMLTSWEEFRKTIK